MLVTRCWTTLFVQDGAKKFGWGWELPSLWLVCCIFPGEGSFPIQSCLSGQRDRQGLTQQPTQQPSPLSLWEHMDISYLGCSPGGRTPKPPHRDQAVALAPGSEQEWDLQPWKSVSWENPETRALSSPMFNYSPASGSCCLFPAAESLMLGAAWGRGRARGMGGSGCRGVTSRGRVIYLWAWPGAWHTQSSLG